jgi:hypothetical protein
MGYQMSKLPSILKDKKGSETFLDYAGPFLMPFLEDKDNATNEQIEMALRIPWVIWNASVMANHSEKTVDYMGSIRLLINNQPTEAKQWINMLKERKKLLFSQYNYLFGKYKVQLDKNTGEVRLSMETRTVPNT